MALAHKQRVSKRKALESLSPINQVFRPFPAQAEIIRDTHRFKTINCGRKWGKTELIAVIGGDFALNNPGSIVWIIAPTYRQANFVLAALNKYLPQNEILYTSGFYSTKFLKNGSQIEVNTSLQPENLRGPQIDLAIFDEFASVNNGGMIFDAIIRAMLATRFGRAIFVSTPKGKATAFHKYFLRGMDKAYPDWKSWHFKSTDSPYFPQSEYDDAKKDTPHQIFLQEYDAEFIDASNSVFLNVQNCITYDITDLYDDEGEVVIENYNPQHTYGIGCDPADRSTYCVISVIDYETGDLVYFNRFQRKGYRYIVNALKDATNRYHNKVVIDSTGIGNPICELLREEDIWHEPYLFTNQSKNDLLSHLQVSIEKEYIRYPYINQLITELTSLQYEYTPSNHMIYVSQHFTDTVMSLALSCLHYDPIFGKDFALPTMAYRS